jgi:ubiquinone/menaquinone biosynthesis C-methylase UbiE
MTIGETARTDDYLLGDSQTELDHLVAQANVYAPETERLLDVVGLAPDSHAIDLGCGVLGILHLLAARVGPEGRVVGLDREPQMVATARRLAEERGLDLDLELVEGDATATELPRESFDFVHARTVMLNIPQPRDLAREMLALARPGGVVAVQEPDSASWTCDPPHPAFDSLLAALREAYRLSGRHFDMGRSAARVLREAGLRDVQVRATARVTQPGEYYQTFLLTLTGLVRDPIVSAGLLSEEELEASMTALREHLEAPGTITCQPLIWQAWGVKAS